ncbi:hypothetical protein AMATHDRAFT_56361 [Amanita thiersii Skay4041]|uniref:BRCT domain-containing protein n=1 Tax=Amanita thiersii Skay4041 TaxID=703135 RepID=A0A2A9NRW3_9AGAR|nr:hypothetical protein AMATHDRAFT_56361 [Amanita thiersii Skay4041]
MKTLDQYFTVSRPTTHRNSEETKPHGKYYHPYKSNPVRVPSHVATTKILLGTLSSSSNPITHSDIRKRTDIVVSTATGHQVAEGSANRLLYLQERDRKLEAQRECTTCDQNRALYLVRAYIDGYLEGTTDIEIKRLICTGGGRVMSTASNCTHIVTSRTLAASKVEGLLCGHKLNKVYIVRPEWVIDSMTIGKRQSEHNYSIKLNIM